MFWSDRVKVWWGDTLKLAAKTGDEEIYEILRAWELKKRDEVSTFEQLKRRCHL
jgi:hypothetical protein